MEQPGTASAALGRPAHPQGRGGEPLYHQPRHATENTARLPTQTAPVRCSPPDRAVLFENTQPPVMMPLAPPLKLPPPPLLVAVLLTQVKPPSTVNTMLSSASKQGPQWALLCCQTPPLMLTVADTPASKQPVVPRHSRNQGSQMQHCLRSMLGTADPAAAGRKSNSGTRTLR